MNKNILIGLVVVVVLIFIGVSFADNKAKVKDVDMDDTSEIVKNFDTEKGEVEEGDMSKEGDMMKEPSSEELMSGSYEAYSPERLMKAENGDVVLFFHASWCPTCRSADKNITENLESIPNGLTLLKVNYDTEVALKQKYEIRYQHTFVQVDKDGNVIKTWTGSPTLDAIVKEVI